LKKKILCFLLLLISISVLNCSEILYINLTSGETISIPIALIEQITFSDSVSISDMVNLIQKIPIRFLKNYPNPFNPVTNIVFELNVSGKTQIEIFNAKGQKVKTLMNKKLEKGNHSIAWDGKNNQNNSVSSGVYFYRVSVNGAQKINKMLMIK